MSSNKLVGKYRRGTAYKVSFPTLPSLKAQPLRIILTQKQERHDVMDLKFPRFSQKWFKLLKTGVPIQVTWKQGIRKRTWVGYVSFVKKVTSSQRVKFMTVRCIGASFVLKESKPRTFKQKTIPEVAAILAKESGLKFVGENDSRRFEQLNISGISYWEWLQEHAKKIGYALYVDGASLVFRPIEKVLESASKDVPLFQLWNQAIPANNYQLDRTLDSLTVMNGEFLEDNASARTTKQVGGVDPVTNKSFTAKFSPDKAKRHLRSKVSSVLFDAHLGDQVVNHEPISKKAAEGLAQLSRFNLPAAGRGQGDPRVKPYSLVTIDGAGPVSSGYWLVREAVHTLNKIGEYSLEMVIATDGVERNAGATTDERVTQESIIGTVNIGQALLEDPSFTSSTGVTYIKLNPNKETKLVLKKPLLTSINNQGFVRTGARWQSSAPLSTPFARNRGKCSCC